MSDIVALLNAPVLTSDGVFDMRTISLEAAVALCGSRVTESYIGHASTASILQRLLDVPVPVSRAEFRHGVGADALIFSLNKRQPEGVVLSEAEVEAIGYTFRRLTRLE